MPEDELDSLPISSFNSEDRTLSMLGQVAILKPYHVTTYIY